MCLKPCSGIWRLQFDVSIVDFDFLPSLHLFRSLFLYLSPAISLAMFRFLIVCSSSVFTGCGIC